MSISNLVQEYETSKKSFMEKLQASFKTEIQDIFQKNPSLKYIFWTQYTPYFNDGDTCEFRVHDIDFIMDFFEDGGNIDDINDIEMYGEYSFEYVSGIIPTSWRYDRGGKEKVEKLTQDQREQLDRVYQSITDIQAIPDGVFLGMFGDHAKVIVDREKGIIVEEYDHD